MRTLVYNKTILLFLNIYDLTTLKKCELKNIKNMYLESYDNCIVYNYFDLRDHKHLIKDKINKLLFKNQIKINARECNIQHIESTHKNSFLNENHIQGSDKSQIFYGSYYNGELIAVISFDNKKGMNGGINVNTYDLSRFSIKTGYVIVGIFNRMLKAFITDYSPKKIISYADLNVVNKNTNIYTYNGFIVGKTIQPDYKVYLKTTNELYHKFTYGNKFFTNSNKDQKEKETIKSNIIKVWNCGKLRYELYFNDNNKIIYGYVYQIKNLLNNKVYIGQTTRTLNKRIYEYKSAYNRNLFYNQHLLNAFNKYEWKNFQFNVIDTATNLEELNQKEIYYIKEYNSNNSKFGYNIESGGGNSLPSIETLEKMSKSHLGIVQNSTWINNRISKSGTEEAKKYGKRKTEEERLNLSVKSPRYWLGKSRDIETKDKISKTKIADGLSDKQKEVLCKKVYKRNAETGEIIDIFDSTASASKKENVAQSTISRRCEKNKIIKDISWSY